MSSDLLKSPGDRNQHPGNIRGGNNEPDGHGTLTLVEVRSLLMIKPRSQAVTLRHCLYDGSQLLIVV